MKKKIFALVLCIAMLAIAVGGTLAYFTDNDAKTNVFTVGNIAIDLYETFNEAAEEMIPAVIVDKDDGSQEFRNALQKEVYIENTGSQEAWVRVHIAVPAVNDNGYFIGQFGQQDEAIKLIKGAEDWNWNVSAEDGAAENMYDSFNIEGIPYKAYVATCKTKLIAGDATSAALDKVYMNSYLTQDMIDWLNGEFGKAWTNVYVFAEAVQADGFDDPFTAFDAAFEDVGTYEIDWTAVGEGN